VFVRQSDQRLHDLRARRTGIARDRLDPRDQGPVGQGLSALQLKRGHGRLLRGRDGRGFVRQPARFTTGSIARSDGVMIVSGSVPAALSITSHAPRRSAHPLESKADYDHPITICGDAPLAKRYIAFAVGYMQRLIRRIRG
jgi:hypothetical protein